MDWLAQAMVQSPATNDRFAKQTPEALASGVFVQFR